MHSTGIEVGQKELIEQFIVQSSLFVCFASYNIDANRFVGLPCFHAYD